VSKDREWRKKSWIANPVRFGLQTNCTVVHKVADITFQSLPYEEPLNLAGSNWNARVSPHCTVMKRGQDPQLQRLVRADPNATFVSNNSLVQREWRARITLNRELLEKFNGIRIFLIALYNFCKPGGSDRRNGL